MRIAARKDARHKIVGDIFMNPENGYQGLDLSRLGDGKPDWLFVRNCFPVLVEVKTPGWKDHIKQGTAERQQAFSAIWTACPVIYIETVEQAWLEAGIYRGPK